MKWLSTILSVLVVFPMLVLGQAQLTETFISNTAKIQISLPVNFSSVINTNTLSIRISNNDDLEFVVLSPTSFDQLEFGDVTRNELVEALVGTDATVENTQSQRVDERNLTLVSFTEDQEEKMMILVPFGDDSFAILRVIAWEKVRHEDLLVNISASIIDLADEEDIPAASFSSMALSQSFILDDANLSFDLPDDWSADFDRDNYYISLDSDDITLFVFTPEKIRQGGFGTIRDGEELLQKIIEVYDWTFTDVRTTRVNGRSVYVADYRLDNFRGILTGVELENGTFAVIDTIEWTRSQDRQLVIDITASFNLINNQPVADYSGDWQEVVASLEDSQLISPGGGIVFVEESAFFTGQGNWFTPLASRSPQTNFVMAATLSYTPGDVYRGGDFETCSLLARLQDDPATGSTTRFMEVGVDNTEVFYYLSLEDGRQTHYEEFADIQLGQSYHVLFIVEEDTITIFIDGALVVDKEDIQFGTGTFGIGLRGLGPDAECVGDNIWVYRLPDIQDGICRVTSGTNVNRRFGPGTNFDIAGQLLAGTSQEVIGKTVGEDNFVWWQLFDESWVRNDVIELSGDCRDVGTAQADI